MDSDGRRESFRLGSRLRTFTDATSMSCRTRLLCLISSIGLCSLAFQSEYTGKLFQFLMTNIYCFVQSSEIEEVENVSNGAASPGSVTSTASKRLERQVNEDVRATMAAIFPSLETELNNFIGFLDKIDSL